VTATDNQFHVSADLGTVAPGETINRTFNTELQSFGAGSVTVKAAKASDESVFTTDTVNYSAFSCNGSVTPTPTQGVTPTPTQAITPTPTTDDSGSSDGSGNNNCENQQNNNGGNANNNCNDNSNNQTQDQTQNNNQEVNVTVNGDNQVLGASDVTNLPSTGTPLSDILLLGGMLPTGFILRKFTK
jgi:hypothetical protein